jgi:hypothetical protein
MTLAEIHDALPNGFHDAEIEEFSWNFCADVAVFTVDFWVATEETDREERRRGTVQLRGLVFLTIDPPSPSPFGPKPYRCGPETLQIDGIPTTAEIFPKLPELKSDLPQDVGIFSFFVNNWNTYIHIATQEAKLTWLGPSKPLKA